MYSNLNLIAVILALAFVSNIQCQINDLKLARLFFEEHAAKLQEEAAFRAPGEHNHELGQFQDLLDQSQFPTPFSQQQGMPVPAQQQFAQAPQPPNLMNSFSKFTPQSQLVNNFATTGLRVTERLLASPPQQFQSPRQPLFQQQPVQQQLQQPVQVQQQRQQPIRPAGRQTDFVTPVPVVQQTTTPAINLANIGQLKAPSRFCPFKTAVKCDPQFPYRSLDGSCNNLNNFWWGQSETPYKRYLDADYNDQFKLNEPRGSLDGSELPNPRDIACNIHTHSEEIEPFISHMFMQWGQLVNHDITSISSTRDDDPDKTVCNTCTKSSKCLPITINPNASCSCQVRMLRGCIEFTRSSASFGDIQCSLGRREQLNLVTSFLDGSHIYGSSISQLETLRDRSKGKGLMLIQQRNGRDLLPVSKVERPSDCLDFTQTTKCFHAGDDRINQNPSLMSMQTIFIREHNRIANTLSRLNPTWPDEIVFEETRRIIIAMIQHITYNEYLPILFGPKNMQLFNLNPLTGFDFFTKYNSSVDPRIANEYAAAAGRFGHSMVRSEYSRLNNNFTSAGSQSFMLRNSYFRANGLYDECQGGLESIVRGMLKDPIMKVDRHFSSDLSQHLFEVKDKFGRPFHFDLVSINILRGRDHGIPSYTKHREFCGLPPIRSWNDMKRFIQADTVDTLRQFYKSPEDVDVFVASMSENKEEGSLLGPTLNCILGLQFQNLKFGDRYWYETSDFPANFTPGQLSEIRKATLAKLLCRTLADTPMIQPHAMLTRQLEDNQLVRCDSLPDINWNFWKSS